MRSSRAVTILTWPAPSLFHSTTTVGRRPVQTYSASTGSDARNICPTRRLLRYIKQITFTGLLMRLGAPTFFLSGLRTAALEPRRSGPIFGCPSDILPAFPRVSSMRPHGLCSCHLSRLLAMIFGQYVPAMLTVTHPPFEQLAVCHAGQRWI